MPEPFIAEIRIFAGNFVPRGWAMCDGQLLPIAQNTALFALVGTVYGGDGRSTFALPDLRGRAPMFWGQGPGLTSRDVGEGGGSQNVTLKAAEMPAHGHVLSGSLAEATSGSPGSAVLAVGAQNAYSPIGAKRLEPMHPDSVGTTGGDQPHNNMQPYLGLSFIISLQGIFPSRP